MSDDPLQPRPGAQPVGDPNPFNTAAASSSHPSRGSSTTTGLRGTTQTFDDGTIVTDATEQMHAKRAEGLDNSLTGHWRRVQKGNSFAIRQEHYSHKGRAVPDGALFIEIDDLSAEIPEGFTATTVTTGKATMFGKGDREDEGTGSPLMGTIQTNSEVVGGSVKVSIMARVFGSDWQHDEKRLRALIDVYFSQSRRMVRVPLVDIGPAEHLPSGAEVDLTMACDQFLKTQGLATVEYRLLVPNT